MTRLTGLTRRLADLAPIAACKAEGGSDSLYGLLAAARPAVIASLAEDRSETFLVVTAHAQAAHDLAHDLQHWSGREVAFFPAFESLPYERVHLDRSILVRRDNVVRAVARNDLGLIVAPVRALLQPVERPQESAEDETVLRPGQRVTIEALLASLMGRGYTEADLVEEEGTFSRRGGVVDLYPAGDDFPARVEFFGNEIDSIRRFDASTQRSLASTDEVRIAPLSALGDAERRRALRELRSIDMDGMSAESQSLWQEDLARLEGGAALEEVSVFGPYLWRDPVSLADILPDGSRVVVDSADETWSEMEDLWRQSVEVQRDLEEAGNLPTGLRPSLLKPECLKSVLTGFDCLQFLGGSSPNAGGKDWSDLFTPPRVYKGRLRSLQRDVAADAKVTTVIATQQLERTRELLTEIDVPVHTELQDGRIDPSGVTLVALPVSQGWVTRAGGVTFLTDHEIYGRALARPAPRKPRKARQAFFTDFSSGDFVVHLEHGIGRFDGVTRMEIEGAEREYAIVQYAGADRVYVPTDQLERLTRYVGMGETAPRLSKLGGGEWQRARQRANAAAAEIASELIDLYARRQTRAAHAFSRDLPWQAELESSFAYPETPDQLRAVEDVKADMEAPQPMDRLVCADVGYGKTEVAVRAAFKAVMDGKQVAVLVPTTILAQQHFETFTERFAAFPLSVEVLSRFRPPAQQREILSRVRSGEVDVLIGTHRILQKDVDFKRLGLLVIDEEQRFGVKHKEQLKRLRESIDVLTLTATPIPRTLHTGLVGIREISVIETPPEGRLPIKTHLRPFDERLLREAVLRELDRDGQVYLVHNRVQTIEAMAERVRTLVPEARVVVAHGQMEDALLERVMLSFAHAEADVLICSTIIENGLDIPNVNTIVLNNAHKLGLTQLYQLRGRVGRSANQAYAYLLYPRDVRLSREAARRMEAVFEAQDLGAGFSIAMKDLEIRGAGNLLGAEQSGHAQAIGFDLYTRMIGEAVERLRGVAIEETPAVSLNIPLSAFLPAGYVGSESERLTLYRRLAAVESTEQLQSLTEEMEDRFGALPEPVLNLVTTVRLKLMARTANVISISMGSDTLTIRAEQGAMFDRVSLYRAYGMEARISNALLRIPRSLLGDAWLERLETILHEMTALRHAVRRSSASSAPEWAAQDIVAATT